MSAAVPRSTPQKQLNTRALELAARAFERAEQVDNRVTDHFGILTKKMDENNQVRAEQHAQNQDELKAIQRAMWTAATGLIGLLGSALVGGLIYAMTHTH